MPTVPTSGSPGTTLLDAARAGDLARVRGLLASGANPRVGDGRDLPLHVAAARGPLALVETLIAGGALTWDRDVTGRDALETARDGRCAERTAIVALLDRSHVADPAFREAVAAIHAGDVAALAALLDDRPQLLHERNVGPNAYRLAARHDYFRDPKLFWFVAGNPTIAPLASNVLEIARVMIARGVERADLDYTLELVMTGAAAREQGHQTSLMRLLVGAGARIARDAVVAAGAYRETEALREATALGYPADATIAAALGDDAALVRALSSATRDDVQVAFGLAIVNGHAGTARLALDAGADVNAWLPVHAHATALHRSAADDRADLIALLRARGARPDVRDTLWDATPCEWAIHLGRTAARAALEASDQPPSVLPNTVASPPESGVR